MVGKKIKRLRWDRYFFRIAKVVASRSTCLEKQVGAVIVNEDHVIISTGYNGSPRGVVNCCDTGVCKRQKLNIPCGERYELCEAVCAEQNAIVHAPPEKMKGATIYIYARASRAGVSGEPCVMCKRFIINAQIACVMFRDGRHIIKQEV